MASELEVSTSDQRFFLRRILPYFTDEGDIGGVVVTFAPIDMLRPTEQRSGQTKSDSVRLPILRQCLSGWRTRSKAGIRQPALYRRHRAGSRKSAWLKMAGTCSCRRSSDYLATCASAEAGGGGYDHELRLRKGDGSLLLDAFFGVRGSNASGSSALQVPALN